MTNSATKHGFENVAIFISELLGTALLVFLCCSNGLCWNNKPIDPLQGALTSGFAVLICIQIFGCISGAHINPSVTVAATIYNLISVQMACVYILAQILGAFMGFGLLMAMLPLNVIEASGEGFGLTKPNPSITPLQAFGIEFIATSVLIFICCGVWDPRNAKVQDSVPIRFGLAIAGLISVTANFTGGSFNPARSFGPALWTGDFESNWIYWAAPLSAAFISSVVYKYVFRREVIETDPAQQFSLESVDCPRRKDDNLQCFS